MIEKTVLYIGDDKNYWHTVKNRFQATYEHVTFTFVEKLPFEEAKINENLVELIELDPDFIYVDLCSHEKSLLEFGQFIKRINSFRLTPLVGLTDKLEKSETMVISGYDFVFIKGGELHDVVYHPYCYRFPTEALKGDFALARFKRESNVTETFRIGYYAEDYMHFEANSKFSEGDIIKVRTFIPKEHVLSELYTITKVKSSDLYYRTQYGYDVTYKILPDVVQDNAETEAAMQIEDPKEQEKAIERAKQAQKQSIAEYENKLKKMKKSLKAWIADNSSDKTAKKTKVLIIEEKLKFLTQDDRKLDSFSFTVRVQTGFDENFTQIQKDMPHIIVYSVPEMEVSDEFDFSEEELKEIALTHEQEVAEFFKELISKINTIDGYSPFLILFNCKLFSSKAFQDTFKYDLILSNADKLNFDIITQMAELYEKKQNEKVDKSINDKILELRKEDPMKYGKLTKADFVEPRYYVSKSHNLSRGYYDHKVELRAVTESEVFFATTRQLPLGNYHISEPFSMTLRLVPQKDMPYVKEGNDLIYKGLVHSIGESEKKELRQFVNEIFTAHKKEAEEKELEDFKKLNEQAQTQDEEETDENTSE